MTSPEKNQTAVASSSSSSVKESPVFNFISNLSPIKSVKAVRCRQRFAYFNVPTPSPVFTSPRINLQQEQEPSILKREETIEGGLDAYSQFDTAPNFGLISCSEKEVESSSFSGCVDDYLADPMEGDECMTSSESHLQQANDAPQALQSGLISSKEIATEFVDGDHDKNAESGSSVCLASLEQAEEDRLRNPHELVAGNQRNDAHQVAYPSTDAQQCEQILAQIAGGHQDEWGCTSQSFSDSLKVFPTYNNSDESSRPVPQGSAEEAIQYQRGTRRHLQFDPAVMNSISGDNHSFQKLTNNTANSMFSPMLIRNFASSAYHTEPGGTSSIQQPDSYSQTTASQHSLSLAKRPDIYPAVFRSIERDGNFNISDPVPSGIGLHLNRIRQSATRSDVGANIRPGGLLSTRENPIRKFGKGSNCSVAGQTSSHADDGHQERQVFVPASSPAFLCTNSMNPPNASQHSEHIKQQTSSVAWGMPDSQNADRYTELNQDTPLKKRRKAPYSTESEDCKHCNCKKSKCLKLYCECFAAGEYCLDTCACENCFNKPEHDETVQDTRQQIETRNPLAFAPKIVTRDNESPANIMADRNRATPSSARHKRGCNCKKSLCMKKYCECFQAEVGCSDGCRCEGCKNRYGTKAEMMSRRHGRWEGPGPSYEKLDMTDIGTASVDKLKSRCSLRSCYLSPEHVSYDQEVDNSNVGTTDQFSPTWEEFPNLSPLTPSPQPYPPGAVSSLSAPNWRDFPEVLSTKLHQENSFQSAGWCNSSISQIRQPSDSALYELMKHNDSPAILKNTSYPTNLVKVSSPNRKRVSSPLIRLQELESSSPGMISGRKYMINSIPSLPCLPPYNDSKKGIIQYRNDPNDSSSNRYRNDPNDISSNQYRNDPNDSSSNRYRNDPNDISSNQYRNDPNDSSSNQYRNDPNDSSSNQYRNDLNDSSSNQYRNDPNDSSSNQ